MPREVRGTKGQTLLEAMRTVFPDAEAPCGGAGRCGRCRVLVNDASAIGSSTASLLSTVGEEEMRVLGLDQAQTGWRLSCVARFERNGSLQVEVQEPAFFSPKGEGSPEPAFEAKGALCAAVDIGTTTIACVLAEKDTGRIIARAFAANRQRTYGPDVVSRIDAAVRNPKHRKDMQGMVRDQVRDMLDALSRTADGKKPESVHLCGNTTMLTLWEGENLDGLSRMPFQPAFLASRETELEAEGGGTYPCRTLPCISAFIGADITAGILARGLHRLSGRPELLVDIGTNGEIVLASGSQLLATSTAAGPAFEGATVSCGSAAVDGAVDHVSLQDGRFSFTTLGNLPPAGVCGSGLLDLLACLRRAGVLDEQGSFQTESKGFLMPSDPPLSLSQADIRQLQLAKGAIAAGIRVLCLRAGVPLAEIGRLHLGGSFGSRLSAESALDVGLIPDALAGRIDAAGNTALEGTLITARDGKALALCKRIVSAVRVLDLSREPIFQDAFVEAMRFPPLTMRMTQKGSA